MTYDDLCLYIEMDQGDVLINENEINNFNVCLNSIIFHYQNNFHKNYLDNEMFFLQVYQIKKTLDNVDYVA